MPEDRSALERLIDSVYPAEEEIRRMTPEQVRAELDEEGVDLTAQKAKLRECLAKAKGGQDVS